MPMSFPTMESLINRAKLRGFRMPHENEDEEVYREEFADWMINVDRVESSEIRTGRGWDQQDPFTLLANALGKDKVQNLMNTLQGKQNYPYLVVTFADESDPIYMTDDVDAIDEIRSVMNEATRTSLVTGITSETDDGATCNKSIYSSAVARYAMSRILAKSSSGEFKMSPDLTELVHKLTGRILTSDGYVHFSHVTKDHADDDSFALAQ